ncbi:unnamed protein product [Hymenolepis diminuta]|uniref:Uncharacterized protein n=1 Tax=Hymenolepis diminuta TaxID=6216 RepID=A0A564YEP8_HYMDI|nr:unnamed protein product [Hymenolepis diminuta]
MDFIELTYEKTTRSSAATYLTSTDPISASMWLCEKMKIPIIIPLSLTNWFFQRRLIQKPHFYSWSPISWPCSSWTRNLMLRFTILLMSVTSSELSSRIRIRCTTMIHESST